MDYITEGPEPNIFDAHRASWQETNSIEAKGRARLDPYFREISYQGRVIWLTKGKLAKWLQKRAGDALVSRSFDEFVTVECKIERKESPNLFIETYSNKSRKTPGWFYLIGCDLLCWYFLDVDRMFFVDFPRLKAWLLSPHPDGGCIGSHFAEAKCRRRQLNDTWGRKVPFSALTRAGIGYSTVSVVQLEMDV